MDTQERIVTVTATTFPELVERAGGPIVVEFMSYGCSHCRAIEPIVVEAAERLAGTAHIVRVNIAAEADLADRYDIRATPTFVTFENGQETGRIEGPHPELNSLVAALTQTFSA